MDNLFDYIASFSKYAFIILTALMLFAAALKGALAHYDYRRSRLRRLIGYLGNVETESENKKSKSK